MSKNLSELSGRKGLQKNLFVELSRVATNNGQPLSDKLEALAEEFLIGIANTYGSVTFYDFLRPENQGKKAYVCNGSACLTAGTQDAVTHKLQTHLRPDEIGVMCCLGHCHENSAFHYNGKNYSGLAVDDFANIQANGSARPDTYRVAAHGAPILTAELPDIADYYQILTAALQQTPEALLAELKISGARGRGGAGFPLGLKLESCKNTPGPLKFIVCNADEGDPGAYSDRYILEERPHALLLGMMLAGYVVGAEIGVLYIRGEYPEAVEICEQEIARLREAGWLGDKIQGSAFSFEFKIIKAQGAYICGEETALLSSIEGQRPEVRVRPPYPTQQGLFNKPTVVNNVETLACIPFIAQNGGAKFAAIGTAKSTGTKLVCLDSHFNRPGMYEVAMGTPLSLVVNDLGGGFIHPVKALHIGGPLGGLVPIHRINDLNVDFESFAQNGFLLGHASVVCVPESFPMVEYLEHLFEFTAHESCGKCFPCRLGATRGAELLHKARHSAYKIDITLFRDLVETMEIGSLCALGGGVPLPVRNALQYFGDELAPYFNA